MEEQLSINDLPKVLDLLEKYQFDTAGNYRRLGHTLGLCITTLNNIEADHSNSSRYLEEVLTIWFRQTTDPPPSFEVLRDALKKIGENYVASGIQRETCGTCTYDSTWDPDATNEEHAVNIFKLREEQLKYLNELEDIARLLNEEEILNDDNLDKITKKQIAYETRLHVLLAEIELSISQDHSILLIFARICKHTGNEDLGNDIEKDCTAAFKQSEANFDQFCCEVIGSSIKDIEKRVKSSGAYLSKLISVLKRRRYCIKISSVYDCMAIVERETTILSTSLLEEIASEVKSRIAMKNIGQLKNDLRKKALCSIPFEEPCCLTTVETLSIAMTYDPDKSFAATENMLSNIFGNLFDDVVRWHSIDEEGIVCYFPPVYATIVIDRILKKFSFCKMKQIKTITVGYLSVYDEFLYDETIQTLMERIDALEERNSELEKTNKTLFENIKELQTKIANLEEDNENLKEKVTSLEEELQEKKGRIKEFQNNESCLKEKLQMKDKILRMTIQENEYLQSIIHGTRDLEEKTSEEQKEIEILQERISLLSCQLEQNKAYNQKEYNSLENQNRALVKALQQKTALSETTFQQLAKTEAEAGILREMLSVEKRRNITTSDSNNPMHKEAIIKEETTSQHTPPMSQQQKYDPHTENISESDSEISLTAPSLKTCKEIQIQQAILSLHDAFVDSASAILLQLPESITYLHINRTPLSHDSVHSIIQVLQRLKALRLTDVSLPSTGLSYILNVLLTNESLEEFTIQFSSQMILPLSSTSAASYAQAISNVVRRNSILQYFSALGLRLDEAGVVKILLALAKYNSTLRLLTLDQSHQDTAHRFAEANGPIKDRLSFF